MKRSEVDPRITNVCNVMNEMVNKRMQDTGETLYQAREFVAKWMTAWCDDSVPVSDSEIQ